AAIEAMAAGLPVVGARRGGIPFIVADGETGTLFDPDTPGDLARALRAQAGSLAERERMGAAARRPPEGWSGSPSPAGLRARSAALLGRRMAPDGVTGDVAADASSSASEPTPRG